MNLLFQQLRFHALAAPARPAVMLPDRVVTFEMVRSGIDSARNVLAELRLDPERPIGVMIDNPARHLIIALALIASGYGFAPLRRDLLPAALAAGVREVVTDTALPADARMRAIFADEKWFTSEGGPSRPLARPEPNRIVKVGFTSGSTGRPKAIAYTENVVMERIANITMVGTGQHRRLMSAYGMSGPGFQQALQTLATGRTICFAPPADLLRVMVYYGVDELRGSVAQFRAALAEHEALGRPLRLKLVSIGGAYLPFSLAEEIRASFMCDILNPYSSVEAGLMGCASGALLQARPQRGNCFNLFCDAEIVSEGGDPLPTGSEGVIRVRAKHTAMLFEGNMRAVDTAEKWVSTGDLGRIDADGLLVVTGRSDEVINFGGAKVDPELIESLIRAHPAIEEASVMRMIGADGAHEAWAFVKARGELTLDVLNAWTGARLSGELAAFSFTRLEIVGELPKTEAGKIARGKLRTVFGADR